ncbi:hypothetical protein BGX29_000964, partial [Mortierella sp. GBA35]
LLCECSRLRYLETLKIPYMTNFMDIHHRIDMYYSPSSVGEAISPSANIPEIWVCRGLKELRLDLQFHGMGKLKDPHHLRITCGYVARACPLLQDLEIRIPRICRSPLGNKAVDAEPFKLEGGICLFSRLIYLERLRIEHYHLTHGAGLRS